MNKATIKKPTVKNFNGVVGFFQVNIGHGYCFQSEMDGIICYVPTDVNRKIQIDHSFWHNQIYLPNKNTQNLLKLFLRIDMMKIADKISKGIFLLTNLN